MAKQLTVDEITRLASQGKNKSRSLSIAEIVALAQQAKPAYVAPDLNAERKENMRKAAKEAGPTKLWESALLGASDLGAGILQGASYVADGASTGINKLLGTNLDNKSYERVTKTRKETDEWHNSRRQENNQGFDVTRLGANIGATLPLGAAGKSFQGAKVLSKAGGKVIAQNAAVGAGIGGASFAKDSSERGLNTILGAVGGAGGAVVGDKVGKVINATSRKVKAVTQSIQNIDDKLDDALRNQGMKLSDLSDDVANGLRAEAKKALKAGKNLDEKAVARKIVLDRVGIKGTRAQVSGNSKQWQSEAELAKVQGAGDQLREKFISDNKALAELLDESVAKTGGNATDQYGAIKNAADSLLDQNTKNKQFVSQAYEIAQKASGNNVLLNAKGFSNDAFTALDQAYAASSLPANIQKIIKDIDSNPNMFTLGKANELIKILNREYKASLQNGQPTSASHAIGLVRQALNQRQDEAVQALVNSGGNDAAIAYQFARDAYKNATQVREKMPLLQDALKGIEPDKLFQKHVLNGNISELDSTIGILKNTNPQAVADIKQQVLLHISSKAVNQNGQFSPAGMQRALDALGDRKLSVLFDAEDLAKIKDISRASQYLITQPAHSYVNNSNTASGVMNYFGSMLKHIGGVGRHVPWINEAVVQPIQGAGQRISATQAVNGASIAGQATPSTQAELTMLEKLVKAGLISGTAVSND